MAANSIADDTESLDDPESRTEDLSSSEMYDVSKSGDFEPETCDVSLSDEPLHNDSETSGPSLAFVQDGVTTPGSRNPGVIHTTPIRGTSGTTGSSHQPSSVTGSVAPSNASCMSQTSTSVSTSATVSSCSSRFRVIKLDHSTGEPFKRGRWTCSEFYEKDTDVSSSGRTADNAKLAGTLDHSTEKDGHGNAGGLVASPFVLATPAAEPHTDSGYTSAPSNPSVELQHQNYGISQSGLGVAAHGLFPVGTGGAHIHHVKSPSMPSTPQLVYQGKQAQNASNILPQHPLDGSSLTSPPLGVPLNQGPSPVMTPALGGSHVLGLVSQPVDAIGHGRGPEHVQGLLQQLSVDVALGTVPAPAVVPQASVPLIQPPVTRSVTPHAVVPGVQNVPVMSSASNSVHSMPNQTPVPAAQPQQNQPQGIPSGLVVGLGTPNTPFSFIQIPAGITQAEDNRRKSEALPQSSVIIGKDATKTLNADGLQLPTPAVNTLFGISIPIDGDEDR